MPINRRTAMVASALSVCLMAPSTRAKSSLMDEKEFVESDPTATFLKAYIDKPRLVGQGKYTFWGLDIYQARLWTESNGFQPDNWQQSRFALELTYLRDVEGKAIARRSIDEISKQYNLPKVKAVSWQNVLENLFPNIKKLQTLTGLYTPNDGAKFFHDYRLIGEIKDAELTKNFFDIWLSNKTSAPELRNKLFQNSL